MVLSNTSSLSHLRVSPGFSCVVLDGGVVDMLIRLRCCSGGQLVIRWARSDEGAGPTDLLQRPVGQVDMRVR